MRTTGRANPRLENTIERAILLADGRAIAGGDLRLGEVAIRAAGRDHAAVVRSTERAFRSRTSSGTRSSKLEMSTGCRRTRGAARDSPACDELQIKTLGSEFRVDEERAAHATCCGGLIDERRQAD